VIFWNNYASNCAFLRQHHTHTMFLTSNVFLHNTTIHTDKDACGGKLALDLEADGYIILTDGGGIWERFGKPDAREMAVATPEYLLGTKAGKNL
jgi:hypothetical protein